MEENLCQRRVKAVRAGEEQERKKEEKIRDDTVKVSKASLVSETGQYLGGMTTTGSPFFGRHISTWASLALGLTMALGGIGSFLPMIWGCSWATGSFRTAL